MDDLTIRLKASDLPDDLRGSIDPTHDVEVQVKDLGVTASPRPHPVRAAEIFAAWDARRKAPTRSAEDIVRDVDQLRDEWER